MKFDSKKVNKLLDEMEVVLNNIKVISKEFYLKLENNKKV